MPRYPPYRILDRIDDLRLRQEEHDREVEALIGNARPIPKERPKTSVTPKIRRVRTTPAYLRPRIKVRQSNDLTSDSLSGGTYDHSLRVQTPQPRLSNLSGLSYGSPSRSPYSIHSSANSYSQPQTPGNALYEQRMTSPKMTEAFVEGYQQSLFHGQTNYPNLYPEYVRQHSYQPNYYEHPALTRNEWIPDFYQQQCNYSMNSLQTPSNTSSMPTSQSSSISQLSNFVDCEHFGFHSPMNVAPHMMNDQRHLSSGSDIYSFRDGLLSPTPSIMANLFGDDELDVLNPEGVEAIFEELDIPKTSLYCCQNTPPYTFPDNPL